MRYFNTHGPVEADKHYVVARQSLVDRLVGQIEQGKYFTIFAPRQMGKTTLLRQLKAGMQQLLDYLTTENEPIGYYVVFHARPNVYGELPQKELEFRIEEAGRIIYVYLVRLAV